MYKTMTQILLLLLFLFFFFRDHLRRYLWQMHSTAQTQRMHFSGRQNSESKALLQFQFCKAGCLRWAGTGRVVTSSILILASGEHFPLCLTVWVLEEHNLSPIRPNFHHLFVFSQFLSQFEFGFLHSTVCSVLWDFLRSRYSCIVILCDLAIASVSTDL